MLRIALAFFILALSSKLSSCQHCSPVSGELNSIICHSIPPCHFLARYDYLIIELSIDETEIKPEAFAGCMIINEALTLEFRNIGTLRPLAFANLSLAQNSALKIKLDPTQSTSNKIIKHLRIHENAFRDVRLNPKSKLSLEIANYEQVVVEDSLVHSVRQSPHSTLDLNFRNLNEVIFNDNNTQRNEENSFKNNKTYSLQITDTNSVHITSNVFKSLQVTPYSSFSIVIRSVLQARFLTACFQQLELGDFAKFFLLIESANSVHMGQDLFDQTNQATGSQLIVEMDKIGINSQSDYDYEDYYYYNDFYDNPESDETESDDSSKGELLNDWFCLPPGLFKKLIHDKSAMTKLALTRFEGSISVSSLAFDEVQLSENSKLQLLFTAVKGHIVLDSSAFHFIRMNEGIMEIWIKEHRRSQMFDKELRGKQTESDETDSAYSEQVPFKSKTIQNKFRDTFRNLENSHLKLNDLTFDKIFLTVRSYFRLGYLDSDSVFLLNPKALNGFHSDQLHQYTDTFREDRTKISIELSNMSQTGLRFIFPDEESMDKTNSFNYLPRVIEIEAYEPTLSTVNIQNDSFSESVVSLGLPLKGSKVHLGQRGLIQEFCRFYKLRPLMAPFELRIMRSVEVNSNDLIYFSEPIKLSLQSEKNAEFQPLLCTSCLFMYLYRTVHRREDFYYVKDHLPSCFLNLHYKENLYFSSFKDPLKRRQATRHIESTFKKYWSILNCPLVTGLDRIFQYHNTDAISGTYNGDESCIDVVKIDSHCNRKSQLNEEQVKVVSDIDQSKWHQFSRGLCRKDFQRDVQIALKRSRINEKRSKMSTRSKFNWSLFLLAITVCFALSFGFIYFKRSKQPHLALPNFNGLQSTFNRLKKLKTPLKSGQFEQIQNTDGGDYENEYNYDELNEYEYDDDFDIPQSSSTSFQNNLNQQQNFNSASPPEKKPKTRNAILTLTNGLFNRDSLKSSLLNVTNPHFERGKKKAPHNKSYPHCSYNSTDSTLTKTGVKNEFKLDIADETTVNGGIIGSTVNYDIESKNHYVATDSGSLPEGYDQTSGPLLRLETNPLDHLDFDDQEINESKA